MAHIVLLGDSIFDNAPYVDSGKSVISYLQRKLPPDWKATLLAIDGSVTTDVYDQLKNLPEDATHLFLSIGGNDALQQINYLHQEARSVAEVMIGFSRLAHDFQSRYQPLVEALLTPQLPLTVCTIYNPNFEQDDQQTIAATALTLWNDVILQTAIAHQPSRLRQSHRTISRWVR